MVPAQCVPCLDSGQEASPWFEDGTRTHCRPRSSGFNIEWRAIATESQGELTGKPPVVAG